jgi:hypothetical protein
MNKKILQIVKKGNYLQIIQQSHRGRSFGNDGNEFMASNGYYLSSDSYPYMYDARLCVRGVTRSKDNDLIPIIESCLDQLRQAVAEYNNILEYKSIEEV